MENLKVDFEFSVRAVIVSFPIFYSYLWGGISSLLCLKIDSAEAGPRFQRIPRRINNALSSGALAENPFQHIRHSSDRNTRVFFMKKCTLYCKKKKKKKGILVQK